MVKFWGRPPKGGRPHNGVKYKIFVFNKLIFFFCRFFDKPTAYHKHCAHANYGSEHVFWCKEVPLGGLNNSEPFLGKWGPKNP